MAIHHTPSSAIPKFMSNMKYNAGSCFSYRYIWYVTERKEQQINIEDRIKVWCNNFFTILQMDWQTNIKTCFIKCLGKGQITIVKR